MQNYQQAFIKTVTASDIDSSVSNQHELHGVKKLESIFGVIPRGEDGTTRYAATIRIGLSGSVEPINITWYNARASNLDRHEYRLYYVATSNHIMHQLNAGDDIMIGQTLLGTIEIIIFPQQNSNLTNWTQI